MEKFTTRALCFLAEEDAVALTEYAIMLALIVVAAVGAIGGLGSKVDSVFSSLDNGVNNVGSGS